MTQVAATCPGVLCEIRVESSPIWHIRAADQGRFSEVALKVGLGLPGGNVTQCESAVRGIPEGRTEKGGVQLREAVPISFFW